MATTAPIKLAYKTFEPVNGADENLSPVIFLHGVTSSKEVWDKIPQTVADETKRKVYALDARNHGDSEYTDVFNFDLNVDDLLYFMDNMDIQKAILIGHSMGGVTSIKAALRKPERVEMVFSEDMYVKKLPKLLMDIGLGFIKLWIQIVENIPSHLSEKEAVKFAVDLLFSKLPPEAPFLGRKEDMYNWKFVFHRTPEGKYSVKYNKEFVLRALSNTETLMSDPTGQFDGPAYFLYGNLSHLRVQNEEEHIKKHFPKAELIGFEKATHNIHIEFPDKFTETILQRLKQN